jgi:hypothetical protein
VFIFGKEGWTNAEPGPSDMAFVAVDEISVHTIPLAENTTRMKPVNSARRARGDGDASDGFPPPGDASQAELPSYVVFIG